MSVSVDRRSTAKGFRLAVSVLPWTWVSNNSTGLPGPISLRLFVLTLVLYDYLACVSQI
jgi:hypothetical protein